jgi:poly(A) polymerase Pap1
LFLAAAFAVTVLAQDTVATEDCNWFCWVERKIDKLEEQVDRLTRLWVSSDTPFFDSSLCCTTGKGIESVWKKEGKLDTLKFASLSLIKRRKQNPTMEKNMFLIDL